MHRRGPIEVLALELVRAGEEAQVEKEERLSRQVPSARSNPPRKKVKPIAAKPLPLGHRVLDGLAKGEKWVAGETESCSGCRRRIVFLEIDRKKHKAFDVAKDKHVLGIHTCNETTGAGSVYAFSGGIIDSNRRRH